MKRLQLPAAVALLATYVVLSAAAIINTELIPLATGSIPVVLFPAGWLFTSEILERRRNGRNNGR